MHLELLAPAANKSVAKAAIDCGADAVYMGGPRFGARSKAGNSISDISECVRYAHLFGAKIYVTLNTVLYDDEIEEARSIAIQCYEQGVDALIIQDMAWLEQDLPPIALHASTQCDVSSVGKAKFLAGLGLKRLVLARELSLQDIEVISKEVDVELEAFIHGSLCVGYSGQCYLSEYLFNRSGNRGECAQACRLSYDLVNEDGRCMARDKHLLSLRDLALDSYIADMADKGISSFKIEGRLKDVCYVRNVTAYYRRKLDSIIEGKDIYTRASCGQTKLFFTPDLQKGFHRPYTSYNIEGTRQKIASLNTPKAIGEEIGEVTQGRETIWTIKTGLELRAGDGLCFFDKEKQLIGFGINKVRKIGDFTDIMAAKPVEIPLYSKVYRNQDLAFEKALGDKSAERKIAISGSFSKHEKGYIFKVKDEEGLEVESLWSEPYTAAQSEERMRDNFLKQMGKTGDFPFVWENISIQLEEMPFIPIGEINNKRRYLLEKLSEKRVEAHNPHLAKATIAQTYICNENGCKVETLDFRANVVNKLSEEFYRKRGVKKIDGSIGEGAVLMKCKYCIKYELSQCPRYFKNVSQDFQQNLYLRYKEHTFALKFDCEHEIMEVRIV